MIRWGILGTAKIAREQLVPAIQASKNGALVGIASRSAESAGAFAQHFGIPHAFSSYEAMLDSDEIDAVYIPLPTAQHVDYTHRCLQADKHVLCEKPIALEAGAIDGLIAARNDTGLLVTEAFMVYYHPQWQKVRDLLSDGAIGRLRHIQGSFSYFNRDPDNMRNKPELGGGGLLDIGVYPTITSRLATGKEPLKALATIERDPDFGIDIYANCQLGFDGFDMSFYVSTQMALRQSMVFHGETGIIEVSAPFNADLYQATDITLYDQVRNHRHVWSWRGINQYQLQIEAIGDHLMGKSGVDLFSLENSKANQAVIDAFFRADQTGDWEPISGF